MTKTYKTLYLALESAKYGISVLQDQIIDLTSEFVQIVLSSTTHLTLI